ncbi:efflux RND transporter periplasmic adaptor subunit [Tepidibacillus infernus]|uniref:efflux RND transporter periplasmic adaptor subunit n=1 Tax=Tepidibacillus infernus TaxID=1806172 RepID=UPI003A24D698
MRQRRRIGVWFVILAIMLVSIGCSSQQEEQSKENQPVPVMVQQVERKTVEHTERYVGTIKANQDVLVLPKVSGKVQEVYVKQGDTVKEGQVLIKLDDRDLQDRLHQAEAAYQQALNGLTQAKEGKGSNLVQAESRLKQAEDAFQQAKKNLERIKTLYETQAVSKSQLEQAEATYLQAETNLKVAQDAAEKANSNVGIASSESAVQQAKVGVEQAQHAIADSKITAPIAGQVVAINTEKGEMAGPQSPVAQIVNANQVTVQLNVSETSLQSFKLGQQVKVYVSALNQDFAGEVTFIAPSANAQTLTFAIEVVIKNEQQQIKPGMLAEVTLIKDTKQQIIVPTQAILGNGNQTYVYIIQNGKAVKRPVKVIEMATEETTIAEGVSEKDTVVIKGQYALTEGTPIEIVKEEGKSS